MVTDTEDVLMIWWPESVRVSVCSTSCKIHNSYIYLHIMKWKQ